MGPEANITTTVLHLAIPPVIEKHKQNQTNKQTNKQTRKGIVGRKLAGVTGRKTQFI